jgi:hypothetical protein
MTAILHGSVLNYDQYTLDEASNYSISSTSFTNIDGTYLALQITIDSQAVTGQALVGWHGNTAVPSGQKGYFNLLVNGTLQAANDGIQFVGEGTLPVSFARLVTGLVVGTLNTVTLQAKVTAGTMTVYSGAGTSTLDTHGQFWAIVL